MKNIIITESEFEKLIKVLTKKLKDLSNKSSSGESGNLKDQLKKLLNIGLSGKQSDVFSNDHPTIKDNTVSLKKYPSDLDQKMKNAVGSSVYNDFIKNVKSINLDPKIAMRQLYSESGFSEDVIKCKRKSSAGAQGIAQFMPSTWSSYGTGSPCNPKQALDAYVKLMDKLIDMFPGRLDLAIAGYNSGPHRSEYKTALKNKTPFEKLKGKIPNETYNYTVSILQP